MIKGLALPATAFFIFWLLWSVGERVLMNYKGDEDH